MRRFQKETYSKIRGYYKATLSSHKKSLIVIAGASDGKESACNAGYLGPIPGLGRSPGEGTGCPLEYCCLENSMDRGAWWATVHWVPKSQTD